MPRRNYEEKTKGKVVRKYKDRTQLSKGELKKEGFYVLFPGLACLFGCSKINVEIGRQNIIILFWK